mgnify:CR=1 FL=1
MAISFIGGLIESAIRTGCPIMLCGLGCLFCAKCGIINFAMEGVMTMGAFFGVYGSYLTGNPWIGLLMGIVAGVAANLILGVMAITVKVNQVVVGAGLNSLCLGLSSYLLTACYPNGVPTQVNGFNYISAGSLSEIPIFGVLFNQQVLTYIAFAMVPLIAYVINKTSFGMTLRACGEQPHAADSLGINVVKKRYIAVIISGVLGGMGGAALSLGQLSVFTIGMVAGRGYMAWSAVTIGRYGPVGVMLAALLFGVASALQVRMKAIGVAIPSQFFSMFPYVLTMIILASVVGRTVGPKAMGKPFIKGER